MKEEYIMLIELAFIAAAGFVGYKAVKNPEKTKEFIN